MAEGSWTMPDRIRVTTPYSWSVPMRRGPRAAARSPSVSARTCAGLSTLVVGFVPAVGSSAERATRITPPNRYRSTISAGVSTPASR
jgi:hypothetical protein